MADEQSQQEVLTRIDGLAIAVHRGFDRVDARFTGFETEMRSGLAALTTEVRTGFGRVDRRLGNVENRLEIVETELRRSRQIWVTSSRNYARKGRMFAA